MDVQDFRIVKGTVVATKERITGGRNTVSSVPEQWIKDKDGKEWLFTGDILWAVRAGQVVAVVVEKSSKYPLHMHNFSSGETYSAPERPSFTTTIFGKIVNFFIASTILGFFAQVFYFSGILSTIYLLLTLGLSFLFVRHMSQQAKSRSETRKASIDALVADLKKSSA